MNQTQLERTRRRLLDERRRLEEHVQRVDESRVEQAHPDGEISNVRTHPADQDTEGLTEQLATVEALRGELRLVDDALVRIGDGSYGICQRCGKHIPAERLEAVPSAAFCVRCEQAEEQR